MKNRYRSANGGRLALIKSIFVTRMLSNSKYSLSSFLEFFRRMLFISFRVINSEVKLSERFMQGPGILVQTKLILSILIYLMNYKFYI